MSQQKNAMNVSQVGTAFSSTSTRQTPSEEILEVITHTKSDVDDFRLDDQRIKKIPKDMAARKGRKFVSQRRQQPRSSVTGSAAYSLRLATEQANRTAAVRPPPEPRREPVTWHLPYVKDKVVDRTKRVPSHDPDHVMYMIDGQQKLWSQLTEAEQNHLRYHQTAVQNTQPGFASETWTTTNIGRSNKPFTRPPRAQKVEVRGGFVTLEPRHWIPFKLFSKTRLEEFRITIATFLTVKQKVKGVFAIRLQDAIRAINYRKTGADRLYMNSSMATLVHSNVASLRANLGDAKFRSLISDAHIGVVNMMFGLPGPTAGTSSADVVVAPSTATPPTSVQPVPFSGPAFLKQAREEVPPRPSHPGKLVYQMAPPTRSSITGLMASMKKNCPAIARILALLYILRNTSGKPDVWIAAIINYLDEDELTTLYDFADTFVHAVFPSGLSYQADENDVIGDMFALPMAEFEKTSIYRAAWQLFGSFSIHGILKAMGVASDSTIIGDFFRWCSPLLKREPGGQDPLDTFLMRLVKFAELCTKTVYDCLSTRSFAPVFSTTLTFSEWIDWTNFLLQDTSLLYEPGNVAGTADFERKLAAGDVPPQIRTQMTKHDIMGQLAEAIHEGEALCKRHDRDSFMLSAIQRRLDSVKAERIALSLDTPHGAFRVQPFGLMICGPAGVGKSRLCHDLHMSCARKSGHRSDSSGVLRIDASANFADGAMRGQSTVLFDDIDAKPAPPAAGHDDHVSLVNKYINVTPFNIEQASLEKKGKVWAGFTLALYTTNFLHCRLRDHCPCPDMFWRRFLYRVILTVKAKYANAAGGIDRNKLPLSGHYEIHDYHLYKYDPSLLGHGNDFEPPYTLVQVYEDKITFFTVITNLYKAHYDYERDMAVLANDDDSTQDFCPVCCLPLRDHATRSFCNVVAQMNAPPVNPPPPINPQVQAYVNANPPHPNPYVNGVVAFISALTVSFTFGSLLGGIFYPPRRRHNGVFVRDWSAWFWNSIPIRFDFSYNVLALVPLNLLRIFGVLTPQVALIFQFILYFIFPEFDGFIAYFVRSRWVSWEVWLGRVIFWPSLNAYQRLLTDAAFTRLVRYYETSRDYLAIATRFRSVRLEDVQKILLGLGLAAGGALLWRHYTQQERIVHQIGTYQDYRAPPGVPKGETPYTRVMQDELLMRAFAVRPNPTTFSFPEMEKKIRDRLVIVKTDLGAVCGFRIAGSLVVCNAHVFTGSNPRHATLVNRPVLIIVGDASYLIENPLSALVKIPCKDLVLLHVPSIPPFASGWRFPGLLCEQSPTQQSMADEAWLVRLSDTLGITEPVVSYPHVEDVNGPRIWKYKADTVNGDCGAVLVIRRGATLSIAGFHSARLYEADYCLAECLSRAEFDAASTVFAPLGGLLELQLDPKQLLGHGDLPPLTPLPLKSSLRTTLSNSDYPPEMVVFGSLPGLGGASNKSKVGDTIFRLHPLVVALEKTLGDYPYFTSPTFSGEMTADRWVDPHTISLENTFNRGGDRAVWERALEDFLRDAPEKIQCGPLVPLDDYHAFFGVPETVLGGTNMQSSAGPPFYSRKSSIIRVDHNSNPKVLEWDVGFANHLETIETILRSGSLYSPFCLHVLKDEVVTVAKNKAHKIRVFNILPFAFNHLMKRYLGPLVALMREHQQFFESAVGLNICDPIVAAELYDSVARHPNCLAFDKSSFDARCSTEEHLIVCRFFKELAILAGYEASDVELVFTLCLSSIYPIRSIKGDLFMLASSMPTGFWMTIHFNCVRSSLQARYAWYSLNPQAPPFRSLVSQIVLGDDLLATVSSQAWWYNQVSIARCLLDIGALTTSFRKGTALTVYEDISEVQFLKRQPRLEAGRRVWALDPKTLIKMLCMRVKSTEIPVMDAHAMLLSNVLSESWMWGEQFFFHMNAVVSALALKYRLDTNVYFRRLDFQGYQRLYAGGGLTTWEPVLSAEGELVPVTEVVANQAHSLQAFNFKKVTSSS